MQGNDYKCTDITKAIHDLMVYANFSGFIAKPESGVFLQFNPGEIVGGDCAAEMGCCFAGQSYTIRVTLNG